MIFRKGNLWSSNADLICVTGNSTIRSDGAVVMGRGAALEAQTAFPGINLGFGRKIRQHVKDKGVLAPYGVVTINIGPMLDIGLFQVKYHFRDAADLDLIRHSAECLSRLSRAYSLVAVNFPGIGWGKLRRKDVLPHLEPLAACDNVEVWEYA